SEEHTSELQSHLNLVCRLLLEKKKNSAKVARHPRVHRTPRQRLPRVRTRHQRRAHAPRRCPTCAPRPRCRRLFFFNDTATTEIYPLSLHDALPISHKHTHVHTYTHTHTHTHTHIN